MKFTIITSVPHIVSENQYFAYAPYVREMNIWIKFVDQLIIVAPICNEVISEIHLNYVHSNITFVEVSNFDILSFKATFRTVFKLPKICFTIFKAMQDSDHIHLRCPGNMGLLGSVIQILFPNKMKTAKYAGNWDFTADKPFTYKIQQSILNSTFLTKNMKVLVFGEWQKITKNIIPFYTATYFKSDIKDVFKTSLKEQINFIFVGTLVKGKNPLYAIQIVENLLEKRLNVKLELYGDGIERENLENYVLKNKLQKSVFFNGNQNKEVLKTAYQESHFVILPSESEGWPKAIAEGMFWGCVPIATKVSCVPYMLNFGKRGILLTMDFKIDVEQIMANIENKLEFEIQSKNALDWSRDFTLDKFEIEIKKLVLS